MDDLALNMDKQSSVTFSNIIHATMLAIDVYAIYINKKYSKKVSLIQCQLSHVPCTAAFDCGLLNYVPCVTLSWSIFV